jgi:hypothetical protein
MIMEWIKIDPNNLPDREVLAANLKKGTYGYTEKNLGYLELSDNEYEGVICNNEYEELHNCTHYIDIHKFDIFN